jgi:hypothetical protein
MFINTVFVQMVLFLYSAAETVIPNDLILMVYRALKIHFEKEHFIKTCHGVKIFYLVKQEKKKVSRI